jgi:hypothetical protein
MPHIVKCFGQICIVIRFLLAHDDYVIYVSRSVAIQLTTEDQLHHTIESESSITKAFWHSDETENSEGGCAARFGLVLPSHPHLVIPRETI